MTTLAAFIVGVTVGYYWRKIVKAAYKWIDRSLGNDFLLIRRPPGTI